MLTRIKMALAALAGLTLALSPVLAQANHSWGGYHWARTSNPFTLKVGDNVSADWDSYLDTSISDWSSSSVLDLTKATGNASSRQCRPTAGRVEICNYKYGQNGWLGIASIWASGTHITQGTVKMNDTYYASAKYNTPGWRDMVMCQEVGHTLGLDHQDENFSNTNLGTCMDYTNDPIGTAGTNGTLANTSPNAHDYNELQTIYSHLDSTTTLGQTVTNGKGFGANMDDPSSWGQAKQQDSTGRSSLFEKDLGNGNKVFTFVVWAE